MKLYCLIASTVMIAQANLSIAGDETGTVFSVSAPYSQVVTQLRSRVDASLLEGKRWRVDQEEGLSPTSSVFQVSRIISEKGYTIGLLQTRVTLADDGTNTVFDVYSVSMNVILKTPPRPGQPRIYSSTELIGHSAEEEQRLNEALRQVVGGP